MVIELSVLVRLACDKNTSFHARPTMRVSRNIHLHRTAMRGHHLASRSKRRRCISLLRPRACSTSTGDEEQQQQQQRQPSVSSGLSASTVSSFRGAIKGQLVVSLDLDRRALALRAPCLSHSRYALRSLARCLLGSTTAMLDVPVVARAPQQQRVARGRRVGLRRHHLGRRGGWGGPQQADARSREEGQAR